MNESIIYYALTIITILVTELIQAFNKKVSSTLWMLFGLLNILWILSLIVE